MVRTPKHLQQPQNLASKTVLIGSLGLLIGIGVSIGTALPGLKVLDESLSCFIGGCDTDLQAQRSMAFAAWMMVVATIISIAVGLVSLYFIWRTVQATNRTLEISRESVDHANRTARIAEQTLVSQQQLGQLQIKCYPAVKDVFLGLTPPEITVKLRIKNSGQTPVREAYVTSRLTLTDGSRPEDAKSSEPVPISDIAAGEEIAIELKYVGDIPTEFMASATAGILYAELYGELVFSDVFGVRGPHKFMYDCNPIGLGSSTAMERDLLERR